MKNNRFISSLSRIIPRLGPIIPLLVILVFLFPTLSKRIKGANFCEVEKIKNETPLSKSVQPNSSIYGNFFRSQNCLPHKIILRLPINAIIENSNNSRDKGKHNPQVSTIVTFSHKPETFYIRRIDQLKDSLKFSNKDSCFSGKWSTEGDEVVFHASMERNLLISDSDIVSIIFILSLPIEIREAKTKIFIDKYTWDRIGNENYFRIREYQNLMSVLRAKDKLDSTKNEVSTNLASELESLVGKGGLYIGKYVAELIESQDKIVKYDPSQNEGACAIPKDWN